MSCSVKDVRLSFQCSAKWNEMRPSANGRFCQHCSKEVVDFTAKTQEEFHEIAFESQGVLCGRFKNEQLRSVAPLSFWKRVAASLALLTGPFSLHLMAQSDTAHTTQKATPDLITETEILGNVSYDMPTYKGGMDSLKMFLQRNTKYKEGQPEGKVYASFYVAQDGKVSDVQIVKGLRQDVDAEVKRVVELLRFEPSSYYPGGRIKFNLPFNFNSKAAREGGK